ncbi:sigma-70 family RNA polymerase sigma factor [Pantanalinema sp. GBBB05]|uniref:sigma-70 family RNA polymerase sigma factor n=1 Tax=Pantanalinema sp. GBBB05 TaxID=2604139 RepID=UPI001E103B61|nr:sigma-70 family RNA polymerase sigma factor [Pantanalinema sp. GBBB05]
MNARQSVIEIFSTFIQFMDDSFIRWLPDLRLQRSMQRCLKEATESNPSGLSESFWALYWYRAWQQQPQSITTGHLSAYLQEAGYWVAQKATRQLPHSQYKLSDCFQIAIATVPNLLKSYRADQGASLKTFANLYFGNILRDTLRQQRESNSRTDWGLLRKISQKLLIESLRAAGRSDDTIAAYRLAWTCFKLYCAPTQAPATRQLQKPERADWAAIAQQYNQQRPHQLPPTAPVGSPEQLEKWLQDCAKQIRNYLHPPITSLNIGRTASDTGELQDDLPDPTGTSLLTDLIAQEEWQARQMQQQQISEVLIAALEQLNPAMRQIVELYYQDGLTQQEIATQLNVKQYTVSRRLSSAKEALLLTLAQWSQEHLHITLTSPAVKAMSIVLEEWLQEKLRQLHEALS